MRHEDKVKLWEERHPQSKRKEHLTHQPKGSAKELIQRGLEELHPSGSTEAPERPEGAEQ